MITTVVWGTGNVGRAAIRAVDAHPALQLSAVIVHNPDKVGRDAGDLGDVGRGLGVAATSDIDTVLASKPDAVVYAASGDIRPDDALADIVAAIRAGAVVVTTSLYPLYDHRSAPAEMRQAIQDAIDEGGGSLFASGIDPGWGNDVLPLLLSGLATTVDVIRCQEIFDYSTYDQPDSVRWLVGMGQPMDYAPPMVAPGIPSMVWGGQVRLMARALGVELDEIRETLLRRPLETTVTTATMGDFEEGTQGALRFEVQGIVDGLDGHLDARPALDDHAMRPVPVGRRGPVGGAGRVDAGDVLDDDAGLARDDALHLETDRALRAGLERAHGASGHRGVQRAAQQRLADLVELDAERAGHQPDLPAPDHGRHGGQEHRGLVLHGVPHADEIADGLLLLVRGVVEDLLAADRVDGRAEPADQQRQHVVAPAGVDARDEQRSAALRDGRLDRAELRRRLFSDDETRRTIEAILHPPILTELERQARLAPRQLFPLRMSFRDWPTTAWSSARQSSSSSAGNR